MQYFYDSFLKKSLNCQIIPENYKKFPMLVLMNIAQIMNLWDDALKQKLKCLTFLLRNGVFLGALKFIDSWIMDRCDVWLWNCKFNFRKALDPKCMVSLLFLFSTIPAPFSQSFFRCCWRMQIVFNPLSNHITLHVALFPSILTFAWK